MTEEEIRQEIAKIDTMKAPLEKRLREILAARSEKIKERINLAESGAGDFQLDELVFSAYSRCPCGAGLCYAIGCGGFSSWHCSDILLGRAVPSGQEGSKNHTEPLPFTFYEIKSERQPSVNGATTRPTK